MSIVAAKKEEELYAQIALKIIKRQALIMNHSAWEEAGHVPGLIIEATHGTVTFYGEPKEIINRLVRRYTKLFGKTAHEVCRDSVLGLTARMSPDQIPSTLK